MRHLLLFLVLFSSLTIFAQKKNGIGLEMGGFIINTPDVEIPQNNLNPYFIAQSRMAGLHYERFWGEGLQSIKTSVFLNTQFNSLVSLHIPIEYHRNLFTVFDKVYLNGIAGISLNRLIMKTGMYWTTSDADYAYELTTNTWASASLGLQLGINLKSWDFSVSMLGNLVPRFIQYKTTVGPEGDTITTVTKSNPTGKTLKFGLTYRF